MVVIGVVLQTGGDLLGFPRAVVHRYPCDGSPCSPFSDTITLYSRGVEPDALAMKHSRRAPVDMPLTFVGDRDPSDGGLGA